MSYRVELTPRCEEAKRYRVIFRVRDEPQTVDVLTVRHGRHPLDFAELSDD